MSSLESPVQLGERVRLRRLSKGLSLEDLASLMGNSVTRQALQKIEKGAMMPSASTLAQIARALEIPAARLLSPVQAQISFVAYRKNSGLLVRERESLEAKTRVQLEDRARLAQLLGHELDFPDKPFAINSVEEAEEAAAWLRSEWNLGLDAICSLSSVLEDHGVHIVEIEAAEKFNGLSAWVKTSAGKRMAAVVARIGMPGDRWRFTIAHELAHLILGPAEGVDEEKAAHRFAGAFLAPRALIEREIGKQRTNISIPELFLLKRQLGLSAQAVALRLRDLGIISKDDHTTISILFSKSGWRKDEPQKLKPERSTWLEQSVYHALAEGLIGTNEARSFLGGAFDNTALAGEILTARKSREFLKLPIEERRRLLEEQASLAERAFCNEEEWREWDNVTETEYALLDSVPEESQEGGLA